MTLLWSFVKNKVSFGAQTFAVDCNFYAEKGLKTYSYSNNNEPKIIHSTVVAQFLTAQPGQVQCSEVQ